MTMSECKHVGWQHTADGGGWCAWCEIESLRAEVKLARYQQSQAEASCHILQAEIDAMKDTDIEDDLAERDKRIEELETNYNRLHGKSIAQQANIEELEKKKASDLLKYAGAWKPDGEHIITDAQIDAAWSFRETDPNGCIDAALSCFDILPCEECGGTKHVDLTDYDDYQTGVKIVTCDCPNNGWIRKEHGDE